MRINCIFDRGKKYKDGSVLYQEMEDDLQLDHFETYPIDRDEEVCCEALRGFKINGEMKMFPHPPILVTSKRLNIIWDKDKSLTLYDGDVKPKNIMYKQTKKLEGIEIIITR